MGVPDVSYPTDDEDWAGCLTLSRELTVRGRRLIQQPLIYDSQHKEISVDRSNLKNRFNEQEGMIRTRLLENGLSHLRIFVDSSSVEIFVNDGDAVFTSRVFPDDSEHCFSIEGDTFNRMWTLKRAVKEEFLI